MASPETPTASPRKSASRRPRGTGANFVYESLRASMLNLELEPGTLLARLRIWLAAWGGNRLQQVGVGKAGLLPLGGVGIGARKGGVGFAGLALAGDPGVVGHDRREDEAAQHGQAEL